MYGSLEASGFIAFYGVRIGTRPMFGDQLDGVPGPISRIRDRSATRTTITRGTTVADRRLHARLELQLIPELARISLETWVSPGFCLFATL